MTPPDIKVGARPGHHSRTEDTDTNYINRQQSTKRLPGQLGYRCPGCREMCSVHACFPGCREPS